MKGQRFVQLVSVLTLSTGFSAAALALPVGTPGDGAAEALPSGLSPFEFGSVDFTAIVALSNCSGSFVKFTTSKPEDKGMVLTNGHCYEGGMPGAGKVILDKASSRTFTLLNADASSRLGTLKAERVIYATMTDTDMTLYRLNQTYAQIEAQYHVQPLVISDHKAAEGAPMRVVSGYWKKIYSCSIHSFVFKMKEADWTWVDSIKYTQPGCETIGGTSGSPVVHADTREVIGVNNTGNEDGARCTMNNPCEVGADGQVKVEKGAAYGQQVYTIYSCLTDANTLDLNKDGCLLPKGS